MNNAKDAADETANDSGKENAAPDTKIGNEFVSYVWSETKNASKRYHKEYQRNPVFTVSEDFEFVFTADLLSLFRRQACKLWHTLP